jgi:hypothetical protein
MGEFLASPLDKLGMRPSNSDGFSLMMSLSRFDWLTVRPMRHIALRRLPGVAALQRTIS